MSQDKRPERRGGENLEQGLQCRCVVVSLIPWSRDGLHAVLVVDFSRSFLVLLSLFPREEKVCKERSGR